MIKKIYFRNCISNVFHFDRLQLGESLIGYKETGKTLIQTYSDSKIAENHYTNTGLWLIVKAVTTGKQAVNAAENKINVDSAVATVKVAIDEVQQEDEMTSVNFALVLGRMDYGAATDIEMIIDSFLKWTSLESIKDLPELSGKFNEQFFENKSLIVLLWDVEQEVHSLKRLKFLDKMMNYQ